MSTAKIQPMPGFKTWSTQQLALLKKKKQNLNEGEKRAYGVYFIELSLELVPSLPQAGEADLEFFRKSTADLISKLPNDGAAEKSKKMDYYKALAIHKYEIRKKYKLVAKGYYLSILLPVGIVLGLALSLLLKNIFIFLPLGLLIGAVIGKLLDNHARNSGRSI